MDDTEYVIYRTGYSHRELGYIRGKEWDDYVRETPATKCKFISRGHTISEAINLTMLVNEQQEMEQ